MDRFNALGRGAQLMLVASVLLLIDLFFPWQDFDVGGLADELGVDATFSGWRGFAGIMLGLLTLVTLAWLVVRLLSVDIPLPVSTAMTGALLGVLVAAFGIIKLLTILGDEPTIWAFIGVILAILVAVGAYMQVQEAGGVDTLRSEIPSSTSRSATATDDTTAAAPPPPPPPPPASATTPEAPPPHQPEPPRAADPQSDVPSEPEAPYDPDDRRDA